MQPAQKTALIAAGILGALGVIAGAFAAHGLEGRLDPTDLDSFEVGVDYQIYHALALLALAAMPGSLGSSRWLGIAAWAWITGVVCFSGSIYGLVFTDWRWLIPITPLGGVAFIVGWACVVGAAFNYQRVRN